MNGALTWRDYAVWDNNNIKGFFGVDEYRYLSNFYTTDVYFEGHIYPSSEHAYMASKTEDVCDRIHFVKKIGGEGEDRSITPRQARDDGQNLVLRPNWDTVKYDYMLAVVFDKFWRNNIIQEKLISTGGKYLEEVNHWHDNFWGNCVCNECKDIDGKNNLGKILMKVRYTLRKEEHNDTMAAWFEAHPDPTK